MAYAARSRLLGHALMVLLSISAAAFADDWPQWRGPLRDGVWRETGLVERFTADRIPHRWKVPLGSGYTGPTNGPWFVYWPPTIRCESIYATTSMLP